MKVAVLLVDGVADSGLALVRDVFVAANLLAGQVDPHIADFEVSLHATEGEVCTAYGLRVSALPLAAVVDNSPDVLITPSLGLTTAAQVLRAVAASDSISLLRTLNDAGTTLAGACSGAFFLAEAGVLAHRNATTSWWLAPALRARYPTIDVNETEALVVSGNVITAGAALAHLDLALSLVRRVSPTLSEAVADYLAVGDRPRQSDVRRLALLPVSDPVLAAFDRAVRDGLAGPLDVGQLARQAGVSQRTLQRLTSRVLGMSPVRYIQNVRLERAVDLLRTSDLSVSAVAHAVGYRDATTLGTLIRRRRSTTPEQLRRHRGFIPTPLP